MIIYIHGFLGCPKDWAPIYTQLPGPYQTISEPKNIDQPITLIGYSLGGRLALDFSVRFPHLIKHLILLSTNPGIEDPKDRKARLKWDQQWCDLLDKEGLSVFLEKWYQQPLFTYLRKSSDFSDILKKRHENTPQSIKKVLQKWSPAVLPSFWKALKTFSFPTLFLFGKYDIKYNLIQKRVAKLGMQTDLISNSGHAIHLENPDACAKKIKEFICQPIP